MDNNRPYVNLTGPVIQPSRSFSETERCILSSIDSCFLYWYNPWIDCFMKNKREYFNVFEVMETLLHYESQIRISAVALPNERVKAISQAVARLVDYGTAILGIDIVVRSADGSELHPSEVTTVELFQAHIKADILRKKLLYDYFEKDTRGDSIDDQNLNTTNNSLQVPSSQTSLVSDKTKSGLLGSNSSINTSVSEGRRTPNTFQIEIKTQNQTPPIQPEIKELIESIRTSLVDESQTRIRVISNTLVRIENLMSAPANSEKTSSCIELIDTLLIAVERLPVEIRRQEVALITRALLKPVLRKVYIGDHDDWLDYQQARWTTYLLSMMKLITDADFNSHIRQFSNLTDLGTFIKEYLFVVKRFVSSSKRRAPTTTSNMFDNSEFDDMSTRAPTYPESWIEMILSANTTFLASLKCLFQTLSQYFAANQQIWSSFINCLVQYLLQDTLIVERQMLRQRQKLNASDLRKTTAEYIWISWDSLKIEHKQDLIPELLEPLLRACTISDSRQRRILLPIFYDMLRCDYTSQYITSKDGRPENQMVSNLQPLVITDNEDGPQIIFEDSISQVDLDSMSDCFPYLSLKDNSSDGTVITKFTHLMIAKLNIVMIDLSQGDESFKKELCDAISGNLDPKYYGANTFRSSKHNKQFRSMAKHTADLIAEFMQICLDLREANKHSYNHLYLLCLFRLILFFKDKVDSMELYLNYLYKLYWSHHIAARYAEAGFTLLEHVKSLCNTDHPLEVHNRIVFRYFKMSELLRDRLSLKLFLYNVIIGYFDQGNLWEAAVPLCREMIDIYQYETYEYNKLAQILQKLSTFFQNICDGNRRCLPEYFRVTFYGRGFPDCIRDITVVYRGKPYEKLTDFQSTLLSKYPGSKLCNTLYKPSDESLNEPDSKYLQINACTPIFDLKSKFKPGAKKIDESIINYFRYNECDKFWFSRRISCPVKKDASSSAKNKNNEFADMWREKFTLTTNTLPGILPFFPVYLIESALVSPIESAIEDLERINDRLSCMVNRFKADKRQEEDIRLLGQLLLGIVDAAVNGGISKYEEAFFADSPPLRSRSSSTPYHQQNVPSSTILETQRAIDQNLSPFVSTTNARLNTRLPATQPPADAAMASGYVELPNPIGSNMHGVEKVVDPLMDRSADDLLTEGSSSGFDRHLESGPTVTNEAQVVKLKCLIARQVPLLDEAILLHRDRVADVMRPQHEYLEASYKKLKHHIMSNYARYLPADYNRSSTMRSLRSVARSPNRLARLDSMSAHNRSTISKRMSDAGLQLERKENLDTDTDIPYKQFNRAGRGSLPYSTMTITSGDRPLVTPKPSMSSPPEDISPKDIGVARQLSSNIVDGSIFLALEQTRPIAKVRGSLQNHDQPLQSQMDVSSSQSQTVDFTTAYAAYTRFDNISQENDHIAKRSLQANPQSVKLSENVELL